MAFGVTWLIYIHSDIYCDSLTSTATLLIHIHRDVTHSVTWLIHIQCHMWRDSFVTWVIHIHCQIHRDSLTSTATWPIHIHCDVTHYVTWLIHIHCHMYCAPLRAPQGKIVGVPAQSLIGSAGSCTRTLHARVLVPSEVQNCFWYGVPVPRRTLYITASRAVSDRECGKLYTHTPCQSPGTHQNVVHYIFPRSLWQGVREAVHAHFMSETLYPRRSRTVFDMESRYPEERCTL